MPDFVAPQITGAIAPLDELIVRAMRRFGDGYVEGGELPLQFMEYANQVIDELRIHPYWEGDPPEYYVSPTETRDIPEPILIAGMMFFYAVDQGSQKASILGARYYQVMNQILWNRHSSNTGGAQKFSIPDRRQ